MGFDSPSHWLIVIALAVVLFGGYKKLPEMSRSVGRSLRIFKSEMKGMTDDDAAREAADQERAQQADLQAAQQAQVPVAPVSPQVPPAPTAQPGPESDPTTPGAPQ